MPGVTVGVVAFGLMKGPELGGLVCLSRHSGTLLGVLGVTVGVLASGLNSPAAFETIKHNIRPRVAIVARIESETISEVSPPLRTARPDALLRQPG